MPNLHWDLIIPLAIVYVPLTILIAKISGDLGRFIVWVEALFEPPQPRPAVIAAAQRGLHQRDQRHDGE